MKTKKAIFDEHAAAIYEIFDDEIIGAGAVEGDALTLI